MPGIERTRLLDAAALASSNPSASLVALARVRTGRRRVRRLLAGPEATQAVHDFRFLAAVVLAGATLVAGCGGSSPGAGANAPASRTAGVGPARAARSSKAGSEAAGPLAYSECMRAHGVASFPDPVPGGGFMFRASATLINSPRFQAARTECQKLMPGGGPGAPGSVTHPTAQAMAQMVRISQCMRRHGIAGFPDPTTRVPANAFSSGINMISNINDVILAFPSAVNQQAPAFIDAANACGFPLHNH